MAWPRYARGALYLCLIAGAAPEAGAQRLDALSVGARPAGARTDADARPRSSTPARPSALRLAGISLVGGVGGANSGVMIGYMVDQMNCRRRHRGDDDVAWDCFLEAHTPTGLGWFGGGVVGATVGAAAVAERRGCAPKAARWRALGGALLGTLPGAITALRPHDDWPPGRTTVIVTAPLLTSAGAALAVVSCHR